MGYSIGKTPAIDEIVIKTLVIPAISPEINPLDVLEAAREAIEQVLDNDLNPDEKSEVCQYYESLPPAQLKAALKVVNRRIAYANALDEYLEVLYHESVGNDPKLTPHTQVESTPRFNFDAIDEHLKFYLLQGSDSDVSHDRPPAGRSAPFERKNRTKMRDQEKTIIEKLRELGYDPQSLPISKAGIDGVKAEVRQSVGSCKLFTASRAFDKAWERLRKEGAIADQQ